MSEKTYSCGFFSACVEEYTAKYEQGKPYRTAFVEIPESETEIRTVKHREEIMLHDVDFDGPERFCLRCGERVMDHELRAQIRDLAVAEFEKLYGDWIPSNFFESWYYLKDHPLFQTVEGDSRFDFCLDIHVAQVDPTTLRVEDDSARNTLVQIWLETGGYINEKTGEGIKNDAFENWGLTILGGIGRYPETSYHDPYLDCGASTFEDAIVILAKKVHARYGAGKEPKSSNE